MNFKPIDFTLIAAAVGSATEIIFARPSPCKVTRVYPLTDHYPKLGKHEEVVTILDQTCTLKKHGLWLYLPDDRDMVHEALEYLYKIGLPAFLCEPPPNFDHDQDGKPIAEKLN